MNSFLPNGALFHIFYSLGFQMTGQINNKAEKTFSAEPETREHRGSAIIITKRKQAPEHSSCSWRVGGKERGKNTKRDRERKMESENLTPFAKEIVNFRMR